MGTIGLWGIVVVVAVIVLLYGAKRLPDVARSLGRSSREFKDALIEAPDEFRDGMKEGETSDPEVEAAPTARELELERELEAERARRGAGTPTGREP
jgi:sec-independent protein translocase protein TatA